MSYDEFANTLFKFIIKSQRCSASGMKGRLISLELTSISGARVKQWAQLQTRKGRNKEQKFIVEGVRAVNEALHADAHVEVVVYDAAHGIPEGIEMQTDKSIEWVAASSEVIAKCTDTVTPQGVFAVVRQLEHKVDNLLAAAQPLVVVIDGIQDPGNLGTIIRSADAVGATGVVLGKGTVDVYNPKVVRATMGSLFHLPVVAADLLSVLPQVKQHNIPIIGTGLQTDHHCYEEDFTQGAWIVIGNEARGISEELLPLLDRQIIIPMVGQAESLNAAMATTVILYEALRQRHYN